jgi:hypothetical protein
MEPDTPSAAVLPHVSYLVVLSALRRGGSALRFLDAPLPSDLQLLRRPQAVACRLATAHAIVHLRF